MKKFLGKMFVGLLCIGMLASCGSDEEESHIVEDTATEIELTEEIEESEDKSEEEQVNVSEVESGEAEKEETSDEEMVEEENQPLEEPEIPMVEEVAEVQEPEYSYTDLNQTMYASQSVNVRSLPGTNGERVGGLSTAQAVTVTGKCYETGWYRIEYNGEEAFVSDSYLVNEKPVQQEAVPQPSSSSGSGSGGSSVTVPSHEDTVGNLVWVPTKGGKKYHSYSTCSGMEEPMQVTVEHATALGYTPCKRCH